LANRCYPTQVPRMSPPTTEKQTDDLAARRRRKKAREPAAHGAVGVPAIGSSQEARGLLGGLITGTPDVPGASAEAGPASGTRVDEQERSGSRFDTATAPPDERSNSERVDELIRRVTAGASAMTAETPTTNARRRATGTADLAADAAVPRRRRSRVEEASARSPASQHQFRRWAAPAVAVALGVSVAVFTLASLGGGSTARGPGASATGANRSAVPPTLRIALRTTIAAIAPGFGALARDITRPISQRRHQADRRRARTHAGASRARTAVASQSHTVARPSPARAVAATSSTTPEPAVPSGTHQQATPYSASTTTTASNSPAGPTGSDPLGGIGSCIKGC
jgi:hypothetical protein